MSTRYVWDKYAVNVEEIQRDHILSSGDGSDAAYRETFYTDQKVEPQKGYHICYVAKGYRKVGNTYTLTDYVALTYFESTCDFDTGSAKENKSASTYPYMAKNISGNTWIDKAVPYYLTDSYHSNRGNFTWHTELYRDSNQIYYFKVSPVTTYRFTWGGDSNFGFYSQSMIEYYFKKSKGEKIGNASATSSTSYPHGDYDDSYWYEYKGYDTIDPYSVSYSATEPHGGDSITVSVSARSNTYGGTIYYQYQYSLDNGSTWTNWTKTTSTSATMTIPRGTESFRARVVASDNWGFTSSTYVTGANLTVQNIQAYIGVDGKARKVQKIYIGVNGKAREVVAGYIGVNGKAMRWF